MSIYIVLFCSWLVMSEAAMLTLVLMSLFWCPVTPSGVDRGQHHPALFAEALTITPENISTPDKSAQMLRQNGSPRPKVVQLSVLIGLIFSPGFLFASFAVTRQSQCCCCGKDTDEPSHRVPSGRIAAGHAGQAKKKTEIESSHICPHASQGQECTEFGQLGNCVPCVCCGPPPGWSFLWVQTTLLIWWFFLFILCRIKHANIVSLEEIFESKSHLYLVMQLWVFVCGFVWFSCSLSCFCFCCPTHTRHMPVTVCCSTHADTYDSFSWMQANKHCAVPAHDRQWGSSASHLQPVSSPPTSAQTEM